MRSRWSDVSALLFLLSVSACGGNSPSSPSPAVLQIGGLWSFSESYSDAQLAISCINKASVTIAQSGSSFTGTSIQTGTCSDGENSGTFQLRTGIIDGANVSWADDGAPVCRYTGAVTGTAANRMNGTVQCTGQIDGVNFNLRGTWEMTR